MADEITYPRKDLSEIANILSGAENLLDRGEQRNANIMATVALARSTLIVADLLASVLSQLYELAEAKGSK